MEKIMPVLSTRRKIHEYLGMTINFIEISKVKITIYDYVDGMIHGLGQSATPTSKNVFKLCEDEGKD